MDITDKDLNTENIAKLWNLLFNNNTLQSSSASAVASDIVKPIDPIILSPDQLIVATKLSEKIIVLEKNNRREKLQILALQQFLSEELKRNELLEDKLKEKESELVNVAAARDRYHKLNENSNNHNKLSSNSLISKRNEDVNESKIRNHDDPQLIIASDPHSIIGKFVRKSFGSNYFFGLIVDFLSPYFMVVYEDADEEELTRAGVLKYIWMDAVPSIKEERCRKHANNRALKLTTEEAATLNNGNTSSILIPTHNLLRGIIVPSIPQGSNSIHDTQSLTVEDLDSHEPTSSTTTDICGVKRKSDFDI